ncbi:MAG TPA: ATP-dependent RNA helicase HrpA, partial [Steroidobacteraceae bacterium]|nr:ATP-dependent RNA helicase HrpA [Steroidobacteraceae bacterium]
MPSKAAAPARNVPPLDFKHDPDLPISARREEILSALARHQVLIVAGDTGSGKSTQLPQYCLEPSRAAAGMIAHTQPRRLATRALAVRIAEELSQPLGLTVGFRVRFADQLSDATRLVLMTDGLLLAELATDPLLRRYDTVILDEAHERSLNIDLLLGVLKRVLPRRPELKLIVTSATLAVERIARFFDDAPIVEVSGRNYPIEVRYAPPPDDVEDPDLPSLVLAACREIVAIPGMGAGVSGAGGDILVFLPGEREIRDVAEVLERELEGIEVLMLFSRLSWEQQSKIFRPGARPRIVLATNVAETSITVPRIRAVIDSGLARVSRYSPHSRLQRLPIEAISRASAEQRKGRCGRVGPGVALRLYSQEDFEQRPEFTEPEVKRTNLAALLLRMAADGLGEAESFPFIDPPDPRSLADGYRLLQELQALDAERRITSRGRAMARLPLDPRLARALLESQRFRAEGELLAIVAGLSVPDVRLAGPDDASATGAVGAVDKGDETPLFEDSKSEFMALLRLWHAYRKAREGPRRELRRWCKERRLSLLRLSEWDDVYTQIADRAAELKIVAHEKGASYSAVHRSLLAGFCTMVGVRGEDGVYVGTRGIHFRIFPGSPLRRRKPKWVMAANIVETSQVYARRVAEIEPMWIEAAAQHLSRREYLEPDFDEFREQVLARERVTFLGLTLSANRRVNYGPIAPEESRLIFAREALVYRRLKRRPEWLEANDAVIRAVERLEERLRVRDLLQPPEYFVEFYARTLPRQVSSAATLEHFTRHLSEGERRALTLISSQVMTHMPDEGLLAQFPQSTMLGAVAVPVEYRFAPGEPGDGVTLRIPLIAVPTLTRAAVDAAVPGLIEPRVIALLRSLPKEARRTLIPVGATAADFLAAGGTPSVDALLGWLREARGIPADLLKPDLRMVPAHLIPQVSVTQGAAELGRESDVAELRRRFAAEARCQLEERARLAYPESWRRFDLEELPERVLLEIPEGSVPVYPTLTRRCQGARVRFEWSAAEAARLWRQGAVDLARAALDRPMRDLAKLIASDPPFLLRAAPYFTHEALMDAVLSLVVRHACFNGEDPPRRRCA